MSTTSAPPLPAVFGDLSSTLLLLLNAAQSGDVTRVAKLLDVTAADGDNDDYDDGGDGDAERRRQPSARAALVAGKEVRLGRTALHVAARAGHADVVVALLARGAAVDVRAHNDETPLHAAAGAGRDDAVRALLDGGAAVDVCSTYNFSSITALQRAAVCGHASTVALLLERGGARVDACDDWRRAALWFAVAGGHRQCATLLLECGADVLAADRFGETPLHLAAREGRVDIVDAMLSRGVDVDATVADVGWTPLHYAVRGNHTRLIRTLLAHGARVAAVDRDHSTPLHKACCYAHADACRALLAAGVDVDARDHTSMTPLHHAAVNGATSIVRCLLAAGADVAATDDQGRTPRCVAASEDAWAVVFACDNVAFVRDRLLPRALCAARALFAVAAEHALPNEVVRAIATHLAVVEIAVDAPRVDASVFDVVDDDSQLDVARKADGRAQSPPDLRTHVAVRALTRVVDRVLSLASRRPVEAMTRAQLNEMFLRDVYSLALAADASST